MRGLELVKLIRDEGVSAGKSLASRSGGAELKKLIRDRSIGHVVAMKLDRIFRNVQDCLAVTSDWDKQGIALHLIDLGGQSLDTTSAMGKFFLTVMAGAAELERNLVGERTSTAMQFKKSCGEFTGGEAPYGWTLAEDGAHLAPHQGEQAIIQAAQELKAQGWSLRKIGAGLVARGMLSRAGGEWHAKSVRSLLVAEVAA
jgi:DNA invertase Pin-like site-specific DNA recombinase